MPYPYKKEIIREQRDERVGGSEEIDERDNNKENTNKKRKIESAGSDLVKIEIKEVEKKGERIGSSKGKVSVERGNPKNKKDDSKENTNKKRKVGSDFSKIENEDEKMLKCGEEGCSYESKWKGNIKKHRANVHKEDENMLKCGEEGCSYESKWKGNLKKHRANVHNVDVVYAFNGENAEEKTAPINKQEIRKSLVMEKARLGEVRLEKARLKAEYKRIMNAQPIPNSVKDQKGKMKGSTSSSSSLSSSSASSSSPPILLLKDVTDVRGLTLTMSRKELLTLRRVQLYCKEKGCEYSTKWHQALKKHKANIHEVGVTWHKCDEKHCIYVAKQPGDLKTHKGNVHEIDVTWYPCIVKDCEFRAKSSGNLKKHEAMIHDIDVIWYFCETGKCEFKAKSAGNARQHRRLVHGIS